MNKKNHADYFLLAVILVSIVIVYFIAKPFLGPLILAAVFAFLFQPIYKRFVRAFKERESLAAFCTTIVVIVLVLLPLTFIGTQIFKEANQMYQSFSAEENSSIGLIENISNQVSSVLPIPQGFVLNINEYIKQGLDKLVSNLGSVFSGFAKTMLNVFVFLMALYFLLKDGNRLKNYFVSLSPLDDRDDEFVVSRLKSAVSATVKGNLAIGLIQGTLTGIGFAIFGVPNAVLWGSVAAIAAFLPGIGTSLVIGPGIISLFLANNTFGWIGLLVWGMFAVGLVDNFIGPKLVGRGMQLHPLSVFIAILGGLSFFGPLGFLLGPLALCVCVALIEIHFSLRTKENETL